ncbi:hypothetical protein EV361DRAFT_380872 [Lentinula raphanica]|uniref:Uncharacterized protein n=1 Tax=Lentinula raphanica TaxID=153919 RepID=A0AA38P621_9AGAR|nr:hypothetical protein F5880DRAFT_432843 [Lentinula raphanica]KAJ3836846.1 hypothetical protein F5878DRAFT_243465 [Lentinula raphanica]KAJ3968961.1 hypothetical protein EV361DRAFT_380872 [Lentinula raphanica]
MRFNTLILLGFVSVVLSAPLWKRHEPPGGTIKDSIDPSNNTTPNISQRGLFHACKVTFIQAQHVTQVATVDSKTNDLAQQWVIRLLDEAEKRMGLDFSCRVSFENKYQGLLFAGNYHYPIKFYLEDEGKKPICGSGRGGYGCNGSIRSDKSARFTHPYNTIQITSQEGQEIFQNNLGKIGIGSTWLGSMDWSNGTSSSSKANPPPRNY